MRVLKHYRLLRISLVLFAVVAQCVALVNLWLLLVSGTLVVLSWYVTEGPKSHPIPPWMARIAVGVAIFITLFNTQMSVDAIPQALGQFLVWLTIIKLFGERSIENDAQQLLLSIVLMTIAGLHAVDLLFGVLLVLWCGLAVWVFMLFQLYYGVETMRLERYAAVPKSYGVPWTRPVTGRRVNKAFRNTALLLLLVGVVFSSIFFFVIPRGFSQKAKLLNEAIGATTRLDLSPSQNTGVLKEQVMVVQLVDSEGVVFQLPEPLRLRGSVLEHYEGEGVWVLGTRHAKKFTLHPNVYTNLDNTGLQKNTFTMIISMQRPAQTVYSLYQPVSIETDDPVFMLYDTSLHTMEFKTTTGFPETYRIKVELQRYITSSPTSDVREKYQNEKVARLAEKILSDQHIDPKTLTNAPEEIRVRASQYFVEYLTSNTFQYLTDQSLLAPDEYDFLKNHEDPTEAFLLTMQSGHCEYFAASMVAMCDIVGLPARIVTGYLTDRWDATTQQYIVLDSDAHAWVETEVAPGLWRAFDPTPSTGGSPTSHQTLGWLESLRFAWIRLDKEWRLTVLGFDKSNQARLMGTFLPVWREKTLAAWEQTTLLGSNVVRWFDIGVGGLVWIVLVAGSIAGASIVIVVVIGRRRRVRKTLTLGNSTSTSMLINVEFYAEAVQVLSDAGFNRPIWQPAQTWINTIRLPKEAERILQPLTRYYYQIRFGGKQLSRTQRLAMSSQVSGLALALRKDST